MRRLSGQAARHAGVLLHRLAALAVAVAVLGSAAVGALAWRLAQGPLDLPWLTGRVEAALNQDLTIGRITIGSAALAWEGFRLGLDRPLDIRVNAFALTDGTGRQILTVPRAEISLSLHALLFGRTTLRALEIDQARISLVRAEDGSITAASGMEASGVTAADTPASGAPASGTPVPGTSVSGTPAPGTPTSASTASATTVPGTTGSGTSPPGASEQTAGTAAAAGIQPLLALLNELAQPPASDRSATHIGPFSQLLRLRIHDAALIVVDRQLGTTWQAPHTEIDLTRGVKGGVDGVASLTLVLGNQQARLTATAILPPQKGSSQIGPPQTGAPQTVAPQAGQVQTGMPPQGPIRLRLRLSPVMLASIAPLVPGVPWLGKLEAFDAPIGGDVDLRLDDAMRPIDAHLALRAGAGTVRIADGVLPITGATGVADATADHLDLRSLVVNVPSRAGGGTSTLRVAGQMDRATDHFSASLGINVDRIAFADLPQLWPAGVGADARAWVTENMTAGMAHDAHVEVGLEASPDLSDMTLTRMTGTLAGDGLLVYWLRPVPPLENASAVLNILDPDTLEIVVRSGHQQASAGSAAVRPPGAGMLAAGTGSAAGRPPAGGRLAAGPAGAAAPGVRPAGVGPPAVGPPGVGPPGVGADAAGLSLRSGTVRISGIMHRDQFVTVEAQIAGKLPDAIALLREPKLQLLDKHPLPLAAPAGEMTATLTLSLPMEKHLTMDEVAIHAHAHLDGVHLGGVIVGQDLDQGVLDLDATDDGLTVGGTAALAGIPAKLTAGMDFRGGGPGQVLQRISVSGRASAGQLAAAGLDASAVLDGTVGLDATLNERRDGGGDIAVTADLASATLTIDPLGWRKLAGGAMTASGRVLLSHDRLTGIDNIVVRGDGAEVAGDVVCTDGKPSMVRFDRLVLGRTDARGTIGLPATQSGRDGASGPIAVSLTGATLDLSARFSHRPKEPVPRGQRPPPSGPHWTLDARFDRVIMAGGRQFTALTAQADSDDGLMRRLVVDGMTGPDAPFSVRIASPQWGQTGGQVGGQSAGQPSGQQGTQQGTAPQGEPARGGTLQAGTAPLQRTLTATAANAGDVLAALDILSRMQGGQLTVTASYDDTTPDHALGGTAEIADFRIRDAPVLAHLLQAMTLYGLVQLVEGAGLGFTKLDAPFRLADGILTLTDARAFSSSLGLTARGTVDLDLERIDIEGTIVPAYFFNSLLGSIPLVGRLFSPEQGGGVFAASYAVRGPLNDADVSVNPLSALTPGFLRGLFGLF